MGTAIAAWLMMAGVVAATPGMPREVVQAAVGHIFTVLEEGDPVRPSTEPPAPTELRRAVTRLFDVEEIAERTLPRHWAARTSAERAEFVGLVTDMLERAYVARLRVYAGERTIYLGETTNGRYATVRSRVVSKRRSETTLDYRLHRLDGRWKVYDLMVDGVSLVATYRGEFDRALRTVSYPGLVERLRQGSLEGVVVGRNAGIQ
jgi:phospholipid transport system substrate-binding protein